MLFTIALIILSLVPMIGAYYYIKESIKIFRDPNGGIFGPAFLMLGIIFVSLVFALLGMALYH